MPVSSPSKAKSYIQDFSHQYLAKKLMYYANDADFCHAIFELVKEKKVDLKANPGEMTLLHAAASSVYGVGLVKFLLEKGMDIHAKYRDATALSFAAGDGHLESVKALMNAGAECDDNILSTCLFYQKAPLEVLAEYWDVLLPNTPSLADKFESFSQSGSLPLRFDSVQFLSILQAKDSSNLKQMFDVAFSSSSNQPRKLHL